MGNGELLDFIFIFSISYCIGFVFMHRFLFFYFWISYAQQHRCHYFNCFYLGLGPKWWVSAPVCFNFLFFFLIVFYTLTVYIVICVSVVL
jgi:hypothetical protein